ncbi:hypothetical protein Dret_1109 [Desulfohalobium retbaense DSM 5692]|uniref:Uncharacterized protein n=1 Tax=Desulfohalobium retbaense (strain ATCC 49708 / DSM 5692 / JCM 16813 / HR100) TaxID=485915 RepID=C8X274_DESRD|nr:hypothetical protein Dret_1109 [Desulfohalobium retbaense DSM 5692]
MHPLRLSLSCDFSRTGPTLFFQAGSNIPDTGDTFTAKRTLSRQKTVSAKTQAPCANFSAQGACIYLNWRRVLDPAPGNSQSHLSRRRS